MKKEEEEEEEGRQQKRNKKTEGEHAKQAAAASNVAQRTHGFCSARLHEKRPPRLNSKKRK